jgi:hypothetical protein
MYYRQCIGGEQGAGNLGLWNTFTDSSESDQVSGFYIWYKVAGG